jgi:hypothetical protein
MTAQTLYTAQGIPVEIHQGEAPKGAKAVNMGVVAGIAALAGAFLGLITFGLTDGLGSGDVATNSGVDADRVSGILQNKGYAANAFGNAGEAINDGVNGAIKGAQNIIVGASDGINSMFGSPLNSELGQQLTSLYVPNQTIPDLEKINGVKEFLGSTKSVFTLPDGDLLLRDGKAVYRLSDEAIKAISPEMLAKHSELKSLHEAVVGRPIDFEKAAMMAAGGAALAGGGAYLATSGQEQPSATTTYAPATTLQPYSPIDYRGTVPFPIAARPITFSPVTGENPYVQSKSDPLLDAAHKAHQVGDWAINADAKKPATQLQAGSLQHQSTMTPANLGHAVTGNFSQ